MAVYGDIDFDTGGIINADVLDAVSAGFAPGASYLTGFVDSVDYDAGVALISGVAVNYTALLSNGLAPSVGDMVSVAGREYADLGIMVADPQVNLGTD